MLPLEPVWTLTLDAPPAAPGTLDATRIYVPLRDAGVASLLRSNGTQVWRVQLDSRWPVVATTTTVAVATDDAVIGLDPGTGTERWRTALSGLTLPLVADTRLLVAATEAGELVALHPDSGAVLWRRGLTERLTVAPALGDVIVVVSGSRVMALDRLTGAPRWERQLASRGGAPTIVRDLVLVATAAHRLHALHQDSGLEAWMWRVGGDVIGVAADAQRIYFATLDNVLHAVAGKSGNQQWKTLLTGRPGAAPIVVDGAILVAGVSSKVESFTARSGTAQGVYIATTDLLGPPLVDPTATRAVSVVAIGRDGRVTALRSEKRMMRDPMPTPLRDLPGRRLTRERLPQPPA